MGYEHGGTNITLHTSLGSTGAPLVLVSLPLLFALCLLSDRLALAFLSSPPPPTPPLEELSVFCPEDTQLFSPEADPTPADCSLSLDDRSDIALLGCTAGKGGPGYWDSNTLVLA